MKRFWNSVKKVFRKREDDSYIFDEVAFPDNDRYMAIPGSGRASTRRSLRAQPSAAAPSPQRHQAQSRAATPPPRPHQFQANSVFPPVRRVQASAPTSETLLRQYGLPSHATNEPPTRDGPEQDMLQQLSCPICLDLFTDPVILPCVHSLCRACAEILEDHQTDTSLFWCPECKQPIGSAPLKSNFPLNNMVEIFKRDSETRKQRQAKSEKGKSSSLKRKDKDVTMFKHISVDKCTCCVEPEVSPPSVCCLECNMGFCDNCLISFHPTVETTPEHTILPIESFQKGRVVAQKMQEDLRNVSGTLTRVHAEMLMNFKQKQ